MFNNLILDIHITCSINKSPRILTRPLAQQSHRGDRIKQITTGPTEVQYYDTLADVLTVTQL